MTTIYSYNANDKSAVAYRQGWSHAFGKYQGTLYLVPSEAEATIFQYQPSLRISCILPATIRHLQISYNKDHRVSILPIETPRILISQIVIEKNTFCGDTNPCLCSSCHKNPHPGFCRCDYCSSKQQSASVFYLFHGRLGNASLLYAPLEFANVYPEGRICFGRQNIPTNLRYANSNFWGSTFNNDFKRAEIAHRFCPNKTVHSYYGHWTARKRHAYPCYRKVIHTCDRCDCRKLLPSPLHLYDCDYTVQGCSCPCSCDCCSGTCGCFCSCGCCRGHCGCSCICDKNADFAAFLNKRIKLFSGYHDGTQDFLGTGFVSTLKSVDAIFVSSQPEMLAKVDVKFHRNVGSKKSLAVLGFGRLVPDNEWEITLENGETLLLGEKEVRFA